MTSTDPNAEKPTPAAVPAGPSSGRTESSELFHSKNMGVQRSWLWIALPVGALLVVPTVGLVYAATSSFGHGPKEDASGAVVLGGDAPGESDGDDRVGTSPANPAAKKPTRGRKTGAARVRTTQKPRTDGAQICCAKLDELGKSAPLDSRGTYLAAARLCTSADDEESAKKQARSAVAVGRAEVPEECK